MKAKSLLILCFALLNGLIALAQNEYKKEHVFNFTNAKELHIDNSFGQIQVESYSGSSVNVKVEVLISGQSENDVQDSFNNVTFKQSQSSGRASIITENNIKGRKNNSKYNINYIVKIPQNTALTLVNRFGDVTITNVSGKVDLNVQHGNCRIDRADGKDNKIKIQFGDLKIEHIRDVDLNVQHGDLRIGLLGNSKVKQQFGDGKVSTLSGTSTIDVQHGDWNVESLGNDLSLLDLKVQFGDVKMGNILGSSYVIDLDGSFGSFNWDGVLKSGKGSIKIISQKKEMHNSTYTLQSGELPEPTNQIRIKAMHADVTFK